MKISIITQPLLKNYGGFLQNYALQRILNDFGNESYTIDYLKIEIPSFGRFLLSWLKNLIYLFFPLKKSQFARYSHLGVRKKWAEEFVSGYIKVSKKCAKYSEIKDDSVEAVIVGSDQVWRPLYNRSCLEDCYVHFVKNFKVKKIAYAASFGVDCWEYTPKQTKVCSALAKKFNAISVREESGVKLCKEHLGVDATWVLDPTLLLKKEDYLKLCQDVPVNSSRFMAVYVLNLNDSVKATYESIAKEKNLEVKYFAADAKATLSVPEWIAMFRDASYVVTDSFHGTVFSIIFEKEFKSIYNETRGAARFESLLNLYNSGKLEEMREFSINWLKSALES